MKSLLSISVSTLALLCTLTSFTPGHKPIPESIVASAPVIVDSSIAGTYEDVIGAADLIYDSINLELAGLSRRAFRYAYKGYEVLLQKGRIKNGEVLTICDFSQSSTKKRLYVIDLSTLTLLMNTYVAHGQRTGGEFAKYFSNRPRSHQSSLGFYVTGKTYMGENGFSLRMKGLEKGFNDYAEARNIVVHGSKYATDDFLSSANYLGRSYGCPAVPASDAKELIDFIKEGSCFFIYHPTAKYLNSSKILND